MCHANAISLLGGMPSVLLTDAASMRLQSISFFLMVFLVASLIIRWIWNSLRSEFPRLPRLSYPKALGLVGLWGLLFLLVLTMISGARELMTPGAWKKDGITYTVNDGKKPVSDRVPAEVNTSLRREKLQVLFALLTAYAAEHKGQYPPAGIASTPADVWKTPHPSGKRYIYFPAQSTSDPKRVLACEPELFDDGRMVLLTSGEVKLLTSTQLLPLLKVEGEP